MEKKLKDLLVGDRVAITKYSQYRRPYTFGTVKKVTKTQITVGNTRFTLSTGTRVGDGDSWYPTGIAKKNGRVMTIQEAQEANKEIEMVLRRDYMVRLIVESKNKIGSMDVDTLEKVVKMLGLGELK